MNETPEYILDGKFATDLPRKDGKTMFTILFYFSRKLNGQYYSQHDCDKGDNRVWFPSYDYETIKGQTYCTHQKAYQKALKGMEKRKGNVITALLLWNCPVTGGQYELSKLTQHGWQHTSIPIFGEGKTRFDVIMKGFNGKPRRTSYQPKEEVLDLNKVREHLKNL